MFESRFLKVQSFPLFLNYYCRYKEKFKENSKNYDPVEDVTLFIALAANFYFQYYARVKTRICGKKSAISQQALDSKRSVQVFNTA